MRVFRNLGLCAAIAGSALAGCSSSHTANFSPSAVPQSAREKASTGPSLVAVPGSLSALPVTLTAFPVTLTAFPVTLTAFPVTLTAFPVCQFTADTATAACESQLRTATAAIPLDADPSLLPAYQPIHLQAMHGVTAAATTQGAGSTIAIVTALADPNVAADLAIYRAKFGLPACTVASGCLKTVIADPSDGTADPAWRSESTIDAEMVSALCPLCKIVLVQAKSAKIADLATAEDKAAGLHPNAISNSYAVVENHDNSNLASHYHHDGIAIVVAAGDKGYLSGQAYFPASAPTVVAVGAASIGQNANGGFNAPTLWSSSGSGCSAFFPKPSWQYDSGCRMRTSNDIIAYGDPKPGVMGYSARNGGWGVYGGTSISAPLVAALYGLAATNGTMHDASALYANIGNLYAVSGTNGLCDQAELCRANWYYNAPAGNGFPYGLAGLQPAPHT